MMLPKLGIITGGGLLPAILIEKCDREGREYVVVALKGQTAPKTVATAPHRWFRLGEAQNVLSYLTENNVVELVLAGSIRKPTPNDLKPDLWMTKFLAGNVYGLGDDSLFRRLIDQLEGKEGFRVVGIEDIAPELITPAGCLTRSSPSISDLADINAGMAAARKLGKQDRGQSVIVAKGTVLAREDRTGTDAMIESLSRLATDQNNRGVLVKTIKPSQERRIDLPTIGPDTIDLAARYGLRGIAVEAGNTLILDRPALVKKANQNGLFVIGIDDFNDEVTTTWPMIYLIAGEPSADNLGARLMLSLKKITNNEIRFSGIGGPAMIAEGLRSLFPIEDLSVMGLAEIIPRLALLRTRIFETQADVLLKTPDLVLGIDSPDFNFRVAKRLVGKGIPLVHFVAPSVWAWRPKRAARVAKFLDHLLTLLPYESPYFEKYGLPTTYVGHPVFEVGADSGDGPAFRREHKIADDKKILLLLFGSRKSEALRHLREFRATVSRLQRTVGDFQVVTITTALTQETVLKDVEKWPINVITICDPIRKFDAFAASNIALAASGTAALELAIAMVPSVIAYRMNPLTAWFAKRLVHIRFANLINLILEREAVPEFLFDRCRAELIAPALEKLMASNMMIKEQHQSYAEALEILGKEDAPASERAAQVLLEIINAHRRYRPED